MTSYILYSFHIDVTLAPYIYIFLYIIDIFWLDY